jgi:aminoglycoside 2''-phosphotransferase
LSRTDFWSDPVQSLLPYIQVIQQVYPDLAVTSAALLAHGQNNIVLQINETLIFRFPKYPEGIHILRRETALLKHIQACITLAIPCPTFTNLADQAVGRAFAGYPMIPGEPLSRKRLEAIEDPAVQACLAQQLGSFLTELHGVPITHELSSLVSRCDTLEEWKGVYQRIHSQLVPHMRPDAQAQVLEHFETFLSDPNLFAYTPILKHGDFGTSNILYDAKTHTISGVIDFSGAGLGDPAYDFAGLLSSYGPAFVRRLGDAYAGLDALWERIRFYQGTFALLEALFGFENGDSEAYKNGMAGYR